MIAYAPRAPLAVYMLADHLDGALAAGEDLIARGTDWRTLADAVVDDIASEATPKDSPAHFASQQRTIAEDVRTFELMLIARVLQAREHARSLADIDTRFAPIANLFASGTSLLLDAVQDCADARGIDFDTGDCLTAYVRGRGMIAPGASGVTASVQLTIDDNFLVAQRVTLGPLLDMVAAFLDALDSQYDLFVEPPRGKERVRGSIVGLDTSESMTLS
ncbi:MAG: hypothetical protein CTY31_11535 [Hyphomicrobium sp.]|nr:MAG: hypothetical protein CTY39_05170 [Hyphomicrobium sp.]PPC99107.1 MAG: hypothetical protein CTY31_11535 [Hyphomicrobium sp.]